MKVIINGKPNEASIKRFARELKRIAEKEQVKKTS